MELIHKFVHCSADGKEVAALSIVSPRNGICLFDRSVPAGEKLSDIDPTVWFSLARRAVEYGRTSEAKEYQFRVTEDQNSNALFDALPGIGFSKKHDRIEFHEQLENLPDDHGSPLSWHPIATIGSTTLKEAAALLHAAAQGDPDYDPTEDAEAALKGYLSDPVLTSGVECVHVGHVDGKPVAIVVAQVEPKSGWSRITYMGILRSHRGRGLGTWVHRHGFKMMRDQGGKLYHGGTVSTNAGMVKLFENHGCKVYRRMQEWICKF